MTTIDAMTHNEELLRQREQWFESDLGQHVLGCERALLESKLPGLFGFHLMQLGISRAVQLYDSSIIRHKFALGQIAGNPAQCALSLPEQLPIEADSVDVVLLHHVLEYSEHPHQLLREAARVTVPHGHLLIVGFNPWSAFGMGSLALRHFAHPVWQSGLLGARRVSDWLALLDFAVDDVGYAFHGLPLNHAATLQRLSGLNRWAQRCALPGGSVYLIHARKQVSPVTPVRMVRRLQRPRLSAVPLATPSARSNTLH